MLKLKGFPTQVGPEIELPDMAELLTYPFFFDTTLEDAYQYGSDFQKKLLDSIPNLGKNGKKTISVLSEVRVLAPDYRACTGPSLNHIQEWHIDNEEDEDGPKIWDEPRDIVHLLTNKTSSMTEFFENEVIISNFTGKETYQSFKEYFVNNYTSLNIKPKAMPASRLVTFTNHMHRATNPKRYEFRYMFRVVETDRMRPASQYNPDINASTIIDLSGKQTTNIIRQGSKVSIFLPDFVDINQQDVPKEAYITSMGKAQHESTFIKDEFTSIPISLIGFELEHVSKTGTLSKFTPKNSIMLISLGDFSTPQRNANLLKLFEKINKHVVLVSETGEEIIGTIERDFYEEDALLGKIAGAHITFAFREYNKIKQGINYKININKNTGYYYDIPEDMTFSLKLSKIL